MRLLKAIFDFYLDASIHVALAVVSLYLISLEILGMPCNVPLAFFIGLGTIVCYNFIKYGVEAEKYLIVSNSYHKIIQAFSFICFGFAAYFGLQLRPDILWAILLLGVLSALYALPVLPNAKNLRSLGIIKIFIVALVWSGFTVLLPVLDANRSFDPNIILLIFQRFFLVLALILPFEVRDMLFDSTDLRTVPQRLGIEGTKRFGIVLMALFLALTLLRGEIMEGELISRLLVTIIVCLFLVKTKKQQSPYFSSFWVEGVPIFWWLLLIIFQKTL